MTNNLNMKEQTELTLKEYIKELNRGKTPFRALTLSKKLNLIEVYNIGKYYQIHRARHTDGVITDWGISNKYKGKFFLKNDNESDNNEYEYKLISDEDLERFISYNLNEDINDELLENKEQSIKKEILEDNIQETTELNINLLIESQQKSITKEHFEKILLKSFKRKDSDSKTDLEINFFTFKTDGIDIVITEKLNDESMTENLYRINLKKFKEIMYEYLKSKNINLKCNDGDTTKAHLWIKDNLISFEVSLDKEMKE